MQNNDENKNESFVDAEIIDMTVSENKLSSAVKKSNVFKERDNLVKQYYGENTSFFDKLKKTRGSGENVDELVGIIIEEIAKETDNLLGNSLIFTKEGELHDASVISVKRADMLETLTKVLQRRKEMFVQSSKIDFDSPVFKVFQMICFENLTMVLEGLNVDMEQKQLIVSKWVDMMKDWQKEIKNRMENESIPSKQ